MALNYAESFYDPMVDTSARSAEIVVPLVLKLAPSRSVVDVGCGEGIWLATFRKYGVEKIQGIDGMWVKQDRLAIPKDAFKTIDLDKPFTADFKADLAVSLEVAEHLPGSSADGFVASLAAIAPVILFSASVPLQGGSRHINEQWPAYWEEKFAAHGYVPVDSIRRHIWDDSRVSFFYAQNILMYVKEDALSDYPLLQAEVASGHDKPLALVHPYLFEYYAKRWHSIEPVLWKLPLPFLKWGKKLLKKRAR